MNKRISIILLALCLLLLSAAATATSDPGNYSFDIAEGDITIADGATAGMVTVTYGSPQKTTAEFDPKGRFITVRGDPSEWRQFNINTKTPVKIIYSVYLAIPELSCPISIADGADVAFTLNKKGDNSIDAWNGSDHPGITLGSGSRLTIEESQNNNVLQIMGGGEGIQGSLTGEAATVILKSGGLSFIRKYPIAVSENVNLVISGGNVWVHGKEIDINAGSLIVTDGNLYPGNDASVRITYSNLSDYQGQIQCAAGILPYDEDHYDQLIVFGSSELTLPDDLTIPARKTLTVPEGKTLTIPAGRELTGPEGTTLIVDGELNGIPTGGVTVKFAVKLNANGGAMAGSGMDYYTYGEGAALPANVQKTGYAFAGWYDNASCTGSPVTAIGADETGVKRYWAGWTAVPVITSPAQDRTVTVYEGERATMTITAQHAAHYQWQMSTDGGVTWADCGEDSPAFTTAPAKLTDDGTRYRCTVTGSGALEQPPQEIPAEGAQMSLRSMSRATDDAASAPLAAESPVFTLRVIRRDALPQTGDSAHPGLWLALGLGSAVALAAILLRGRKRRAQ